VRHEKTCGAKRGALRPGPSKNTPDFRENVTPRNAEKALLVAIPPADCGGFVRGGKKQADDWATNRARTSGNKLEQARGLSAGESKSVQGLPKGAPPAPWPRSIPPTWVRIPNARIR